MARLWRLGLATLPFCSLILAQEQQQQQVVLSLEDDEPRPSEKAAFIDQLVSEMTVPDLVLQLHLMFGDDIVGHRSDNAEYDKTMHLAQGSPIGAVHDLYTLNKSHYNSIQQLNMERAHLKVPIIHFGECLHGVGSFKQSLFPQSIGLAASFDTDLVYRVGRAIGAEARSIGIHACFSPVLDIGQDPRWGRVQEAWGEDKVLTSHMGVAYSSGMSKNGSWADPDAVVPVVKHFGAHGAPQAGRNAAPFAGRGNRQILQDVLTPFKAAIELGGARGLMMAYNEFDDVPSHIHPVLYQALKDWKFDGLVIADDTGIRWLETMHRVANSPADAIRQWFQAGGMIQFYDYSLDTFLNATQELVANGTLAIETLQSRVRSILGVKWDLGLFRTPHLLEEQDPARLVQSHQDLALDAARKSIVLLKNANRTLPLKPAEQGIKKIALVGPFADMLNFGDYSGTWGECPAVGASTLRQAVLEHLGKESEVDLVTSWGADSFEYNSQHVVPPYLLSAEGRKGGFLATYYADTDFQEPLVQRFETPALDWGLYPPPGLPSNNFSAVWEGKLESPVDVVVDGWLGLGVGPNTSATLYVDGELVTAPGLSSRGYILPNIMPFEYTRTNGTQAPDGGAPFVFRPGASHHVRIEYRAYNTHKKIENLGSLNSQMLLFWNLVDRRGDAVARAAAVAVAADVIVLAVGAGWNSDGENADRATLGLAPAQETLARAVFALGKPVVLVLEGGRPFAIPEWYDASAAVVSASFPGQAGGQAVADVLFGAFNPGGRLPLSVPRSVGQLPVYYNHKPSAQAARYIDSESTPYYSFGYGLSYSTFVTSGFRASVNTPGSGTAPRADKTFSTGDRIEFFATVANTGSVGGSYVAQVYLLGRVSATVQPVRQLVAFKRVYLGAGETAEVAIDLEVDRYLPVLDRQYQWSLEKGPYTFALLEHGRAATGLNATLSAV